MNFFFRIDPMCFYRVCFIALLCFFLSQENSAQINKTTFILKDSLSSKLSLKNTNDIESLKQLLHSEGYFFFESKKINNNTPTYLISLGKKTSYVHIKKLPLWVQQLFKTDKQSIILAINEVTPWIESLKHIFDEKGESFSEIQLTHHTLKKDTLICHLHIRRSELRKIDKVVVKGYNRFPKSFIKHYLKSKKPFNKELLEDTEEKINQLSFVNNSKKPAVLFTKDSTHLYTYLNRIKANKLDALLGFSTQEESGDIQFNGYIDISLINTLHKGESFTFSWKNTGQEQEELNLELTSPYLLKTPFTLEYLLNIYKQDSSFVNTQNKISLSYKPHYKHTISTYYQTENSTTTSESSTNVEYKKNILGFTYTFLELNTLKLAQKKFLLNFGYGNKQTETTTQQQTIQTDAIYNIELNANSHLFIRNRNAYLKSENKTTNELYRTGGATTMRGFLEQSIVTHLYNYSNLEYRFFTNGTSYLYGFSDVGYFKNLNQESRLLSFGAGYTFGTKDGLLKISYAVGKSNETDFDLNTGLFHVNFVTVF